MKTSGGAGLGLFKNAPSPATTRSARSASQVEVTADMDRMQAFRGWLPRAAIMTNWPGKPDVFREGDTGLNHADPLLPRRRTTRKRIEPCTLSSQSFRPDGIATMPRSPIGT